MYAEEKRKRLELEKGIPAFVGGDASLAGALAGMKGHRSESEEGALAALKGVYRR